MKQPYPMRSPIMLAGGLIITMSIGCKPTDSGDGDDAMPTTDLQNHCTISVHGDGDAAIMDETLDITGGNEADALEHEGVSANFGLNNAMGEDNSSAIYCGRLGPTSGPDVEPQITFSLAFFGKDLRDISPITVSDQTDNFMQIGVDYREFTGDKRWWNCSGKHFREADGFPKDADQSNGTYSFTVDGAEIHDLVTGRGFNYTIHGSGSFTCEPLGARYGSGLVTFDIAFD